MAQKIKDFSLTTFEVWCYKAKDYFSKMGDDVGLKKIEDALQMVDIFRQYDGELFFLESNGK